MSDIANELQNRISGVSGLHYSEATSRLAGIYEWMLAEPEINVVIEGLPTDTARGLLEEASSTERPPQARTPDDIAAIGCLILEELGEGTEMYQLAVKYTIRPSYGGSNMQDYHDAVYDRYLEPAFDYILQRVEDSATPPVVSSTHYLSLQVPLTVTESIERFNRDHPDPRRAAFVMMQFGKTKMHDKIIAAIRSSLESFGIAALRADDKEYHEDLFPNVQTYMHGCGFGIAVFERLEAEDFNPNVSLEVGYMRALRKSVCLLKDKTLQTLQTDLVGKLYRSFDPQDPESGIPVELGKWLEDKDIIT